MLKSLCTTLFLSTVLITGHAQSVAEDFPKQPVRLLVPYTPGGNADVLARLLAQKLSVIWNEQVIVENKAGASGTIAVSMVARSKPDGYTMVLAAAGNVVVASKLIKNLPYDPVEDLTPVSVIATPPFVLVVGEKSKYKTVADLVQAAHESPGQITFGSAGVGSANHLSGELMSSLSKSQFLHVPYKGMGPAVTDVIGQRVDFAFAPIPLVKTQIEAGTLRPLAVSGVQRSEVLSAVPTVAESGIPGFESGAWFGLMVAKNTPQPLVDKIYKDIARVTHDTSFVEKLKPEGATPLGITPEKAAESLQAEMKKWGQLIDELGLRPS
jgi:tripartite-type tricarboxylate transporter receptor subunit TctC